jgi:hypothetical protein
MEGGVLMPTPDFCGGPAGSIICEQAGAAAGAIAKNALEQLTSWMLDANQEVMRILATYWLNVNQPVDTGALEWLTGTIKPITGIVAVIGLMVAGAKMALRQDASEGRRAVEGLGRLLLVTGPGILAVMALVEAGDEFSSWIVGASTTGPGGPNLSLVGTGIQAAFASSGLQFIVAVLSVLGGFIQLLLMLCRAPLIVVMLALWPTAAASSSTEAGVDWFRKLTAWLAAVVLYKPVAAVIYAAAFRMMRPGADAVSVLQGMVLLVLAVLALPALMRFFVPMVGAVGGGKGAAAAAAGIATGAISIGAAAATMGMAAPAMAGTAGASGAAGAAGSAGSAGAVGAGGGGSAAAASSGGTPPPSGPNGAGGGSGPSANGAGPGGPSGGAANSIANAGSTASKGATSAPTAVLGNEEDRK